MCRPNTSQLYLIVHFLWPMHSQIGNNNHQTLCFVWKKFLSYSCCKINHSTWAGMHQEQYIVFEDCSPSSWSCWKSTTLFLFLMVLHSSISDAGKHIVEEKHQLYVSFNTWTCKPVIKQMSSQDHHAFGKTFTGITWSNRSMESNVVARQNTVSLCLELYQMHHFCTCRLATGGTMCWP